MLELGCRQAPAGAELDVQVHFDIENGRNAGRRFAHVSERGRFVDGERVGAGELDQEQIILHEVVPERRLGKRGVRHAVRESVLGIAAPLGGGCCL